ncbi:hypothetical protein ACFQ4C_04610 [Larkinella insperata]|uniref:Uncharacterized protein n=1 Tax=Larkinella insperata TaxID=332158 RepID=A0ABW3Q469_9BACT|nr:hypothetical protein [Larkinella insperata]
MTPFNHEENNRTLRHYQQQCQELKERIQLLHSQNVLLSERLQKLLSKNERITDKVRKLLP